MSIILDGTSGITAPTYGGTVASEYHVPVTAFKNRIINGNMAIDQRNAGAASANTVVGYFLDRWNIAVAATGKLIAQQNQGSIAPPIGFSNYFGVTSQSAYSLLTTDVYGIFQPIEGFNTADLGFGTANAQAVTVSFWVRSSLTGTFGASLRNGTTTRSYPFSYSISSANTWQYITITVPGDTTGTWAGATNGVGIYIQFSVGTGATFTSTAGSWQTGNYISATGATSVVGTSGATFYITGVQLEKGSTATSFDQRAYSQELAMCQRYYEIGTAYGEGYQTVNAPIGIGGKFQVPKRATPTTTYPTFTNISNARAGADRAIYLDGYSRYCLANATGALAGSETFTASAEL